jgi:hypothetical protein
LQEEPGAPAPRYAMKKCGKHSQIDFAIELLKEIVYHLDILKGLVELLWGLHHCIKGPAQLIETYLSKVIKEV